MSSSPRAFEFFLRSAGPTLARIHGEDFAEAVLADSRSEYARLAPQVPNIGGAANVFQPVMTVNGWIVALHRAMKARGKHAEDTIRVCHTVFDGWFSALPGPVLRGVGRLLLSAPVRGYFERQARRSQERRFSADFVWTVERSPDGEFSFVFDECAVNKWYDALGERDLKRYCNFADVTYSRLMGMGVDATETIGLGCQRCALRYQHRRETVIPPNLEGIIAPVPVSPSRGATR